MASPALESMCCLFNDTVEHKGHYIWEGMRQGHGVYSYLCIISASVSSGGAFYQLLPRKPVSAPRTTRELESWQRQNKIICWLAFADLLASIGVLIRAAVWLAGYAPWEGDEEKREFSDLFCAISTGWIQFFYISTYLWTFCYALDIYRLVHDMEPQMLIYHFAGWFVSLVLCLSGLLAIYTPSIDDCRTTLGRWLPQYLTVNLPILMVMIINPFLYYKSSKKVENTLRGKGLYTDSERTIVRNLKKKFLLVILVFYVCWFPNIINCVLLLGKYSTYKVLLFALWNFMALVNPMQAFLNSLVYRGLGGCQVCMKSFEEDLIPRRRRRPRSNADIQSNLSTDVEQSSEAAPLLSFRL